MASKTWIPSSGSSDHFSRNSETCQGDKILFLGVGLWLKVESPCFVPPDSVILTLALEVGRVLDPS